MSPEHRVYNSREYCWQYVKYNRKWRNIRDVSTYTCIVNFNKRGPYFSSKSLLRRIKCLPHLILTTQNAVADVINTNKLELFMTSDIAVCIYTFDKVRLYYICIFYILFFLFFLLFFWQKPRRLTVNSWTNKVFVPLSSPRYPNNHCNPIV